jgi:hypothetical protein
MAKIIVTIDLVGRPKVDGDGFVGTECERKMQPIMDALTDAKTAVEVEHKAEFYMQETQTETESN